MSFTTTARKKQYDGNGSTTEFPITFSYPNSDSIVVKHKDSSDTVTTLVEDTDYEIDASDNVDFPIAGSSYSTLASGESLTIYRLTDDRQQTDFLRQGGINENTLESALDKICYRLQELEEDISRRTADSEITD